MLWQATEILEIMPKQIDIRAHMRGWVSHEKLTPQQIITLHIIFEPSKSVALKDEKLSNWDVLIHRMYLRSSWRARNILTGNQRNGVHDR